MQAGQGDPGQQGEAPPPAQEVSILDWAIQQLQANGYACTQEETRYTCNVPGSTWPLTVSWLVEQDKTSLWIDSYYMRAFGKRCDKYNNHMADLASPPDNFIVSCDDGPQSFRMNTSLLYTQDLDFMGWVKNHLEKRENSRKLLASVGALRKE